MAGRRTSWWKPTQARRRAQTRSTRVGWRRHGRRRQAGRTARVRQASGWHLRCRDGSPDEGASGGQVARDRRGRAARGRREGARGRAPASPRRGRGQGTRTARRRRARARQGRRGCPRQGRGRKGRIRPGRADPGRRARAGAPDAVQAGPAPAQARRRRQDRCQDQGQGQGPWRRRRPARRQADAQSGAFGR